MSVVHEKIKGFLTGATPQERDLAEYSLSFTDSPDRTLYQGPLNFTYNRAKFAISVFVKRDALASQTIVSKFSSSREFRLGFSGNIPWFESSADGAGADGRVYGTTNVADTTDFHHLVLHFDRAHPTSSEKLRLWVDGVRESDGSGYIAPTADVFSSIAELCLGGLISTHSLGFTGLIYQCAFFSGTTPHPRFLRNADGSPRDVRKINGLVMLASAEGGNALVDGKLATNWIQGYSDLVTASSTIPT